MRVAPDAAWQENTATWGSLQDTERMVDWGQTSYLNVRRDMRWTGVKYEGEGVGVLFDAEAR